MRRLVVAGAVLLVLLTGGCDPAGSGSSRPHRPPAAGNPPPAVKPVPEVEQPGPQADPGQCNDRGRRQVELQAHWLSETAATPQVVWAHNNSGTVATDLRSSKERRGFSGEWSTLVTVECRDTLVLEIRGTASMYAARCVIVDLAQDRVRSGERNCRAVYVVP